MRQCGLVSMRYSCGSNASHCVEATDYKVFGARPDPAPRAREGSSPRTRSEMRPPRTVSNAGPPSVPTWHSHVCRGQHTRVENKFPRRVSNTDRRPHRSAARPPAASDHVPGQPQRSFFPTAGYIDRADGASVRHPSHGRQATLLRTTFGARTTSPRTSRARTRNSYLYDDDDGLAATVRVGPPAARAAADRHHHQRRPLGPRHASVRAPSDGEALLRGLRGRSHRAAVRQRTARHARPSGPARPS